MISNTCRGGDSRIQNEGQQSKGLGTGGTKESQLLCIQVREKSYARSLALDKGSGTLSRGCLGWAQRCSCHHSAQYSFEWNGM